MKRRDLLKGIAALPFLAQPILGQKRNGTSPAKTIIKPKRLKKGDTLGIIAPASAVSKEEMDQAIKKLEDLGFKVRLGKYARSENGFLAGNDKERLEDLHWAFSDKEVDAVWCIRGGYGTPRILPDIDFQLIKKNPKIFIGYSDITALHISIFQNTGLVTFHGPVGSSGLSDYTKTHLFNVIITPSAPYRVEISPYNKAKEGEQFKTQTITAGKCRGQLTGGNLSLITAMAGTPFGLKNLKGKILFIEDVGERPYRLDRMLTQLLQSAELKSLAGIAMGVFEDCNRPDDKSQTATDVIRERLGSLGIPVIYGLSFGHIRDQFTLPMGIEAEMDTEKATITFLEKAVV